MRCSSHEKPRSPADGDDRAARCCPRPWGRTCSTTRRRPSTSRSAAGPRSSPAARTPTGSSSRAPDRQPAHRPRLLHARAATRTRRSARSAPAPTAAARRSSSSPTAARSSRASSPAHPSASCVSDPSAALGLQHDVEATPKGGAILNTFNPPPTGARRSCSSTPPTPRAAATTRASAASPAAPQRRPRDHRRHRPADAGGDRPDQPHRRGAHGQRRPQAPAHRLRVTSDSGQRRPTASGRTRTDELATVRPRRLRGRRPVLVHELPGRHDARRPSATRCRPQVFRYRYPTLAMAQGHTNKGIVYGCHELEIYPDDRLTCGPAARAIVFDMKGAFDDRGTPNDFTDDKPRGTPLPLPRARQLDRAPAFTTGAKVTDCVDGNGRGTDDLIVAEWLAAGAPSLRASQHLGTRLPPGPRDATEQSVNPAFDSTQDIDFNHEAELLDLAALPARHRRARRRRHAARRDLPDLAGRQPDGNGGIHAYRAERAARTARRRTADEAFAAYARDLAGRQGDLPRADPHRSRRRRSARRTCSSRSRARTGSSWAGTRRARRSSTSPRTRTARSTSRRPATSSRRTRTSGSRTSSRRSATPTARSPTGAPPATSTSAAPGRNAIDVYKVTLPAPPDAAGRDGQPGRRRRPAPGAGGGRRRCATVAGLPPRRRAARQAAAGCG